MSQWLYNTKKLFLLVVSVSYVIGMVLFAFNDKNKDYLLRSDFSAYYTGAKIVSMGEIDRLYDHAFQKQVQTEVRGYELPGVLSFRNPPITAYLYSIFTIFEPILAYRVYLIINIIVTFATIWFFCRYLNLDSKYFLYALWFLPTIGSLYNAQISPFLLLFFVLVYKSMKENKYFSAGLFSGLLFLKLQYLIAIPFIWFLSKDKKKYITGVATSLSSCVLFSFLIYGGSFLRDFISFTFASEKIDYGTISVENFNIMSFSWFLRDIPYANLILLIITGSGLLSTYVYYYLKGKTIDFDRGFSSAILFSITLNLHSLYTDLILFVIPLFLIVSREFFGKVNQNRERLFLYILYFLPYLGFINLQGIAALIYLCIAVVIVYEGHFKIIKFFWRKQG
ncbi:DUF2029 domain-containing protein [Patescibacteria group bacterium]|nr:DUF2029 domain-containing protein [Patescibacteria group bacterium]